MMEPGPSRGKFTNRSMTYGKSNNGKSNHGQKF
jgi:hypothetical protein